MISLAPLSRGFGSEPPFRVILKGLLDVPVEHGQGVHLTGRQVVSMLCDWLAHRRWPNHPCGVDDCPLATSITFTVEVNSGEEAI